MNNVREDFLTFTNYLNKEDETYNYEDKIIDLIKQQNNKDQDKVIILDDLEDDDDDTSTFMDLNFDKKKCLYNFKNNFCQQSPEIKKISSKIKELEMKYKTSLQKVEEDFNEISLKNSTNHIIKNINNKLILKVNNILNNITNCKLEVNKMKDDQNYIKKIIKKQKMKSKENINKLLFISEYINKKKIN